MSRSQQDVGAALGELKPRQLSCFDMDDETIARADRQRSLDHHARVQRFLRGA